jgi:hypothetical protein
MNKPLFCLAVIMVLLAGCRRREDLNQLKAINRSFENANNIIQENNKLVWEALVQKRHDPSYHEYGEIWEPRGGRIKKQADAIVVIIEELKSGLLKQSDSLQKEQAPLIDELYSSDGPGYKLVCRLAAFKDSFPAIIRVEDFVDYPHKQASMKAEIPRLLSTVPLLTGYTDSLNADLRKLHVKKWLKENFSGTTPAMALVVLNRIENDLLVTTNEFMNFCFNQIDKIICGWRGFHAVAVLNSSYVKQGQQIEVTAGVVDFYTYTKPRITMDGKEIDLNKDATAVHQFTANGRPGKHSIRVQIEFTKPDGTVEQVYKDLKYIIAEEK